MMRTFISSGLLKVIALVCVLGTTASSCTLKSKTKMSNTEKDSSELTMIVGTYTVGGNSKGIYSYRFNEDTGVATPLSEIAVENPSYLVPSEDGKFIYTVSEFNNDKGAANAFAFNKDNGKFTFLNSQKTEGEDPCYIITNGKNVVTANYSGSSISVFPIAENGSLLSPSAVIKFEGSGLDTIRQAIPHLHCVSITPDEKYLLANDLGTDKIHIFAINPNANAQNKEPFLSKEEVSSHQIEAGSGPRHLVFSANGKFAYLINELSGKVIAFTYQDGHLDEIQSIQADTVGARGSGDIHISPDGEFLYASNRLKADGLAIFHIDATTGKLQKVSGSI